MAMGQDQTRGWLRARSGIDIEKPTLDDSAVNCPSPDAQSVRTGPITDQDGLTAAIRDVRQPCLAVAVKDAFSCRGCGIGFVTAATGSITARSCDGNSSTEGIRHCERRSRINVGRTEIKFEHCLDTGKVLDRLA